MEQPRISILAIGTELTSGQIVNRNASWISARLAALGVQTSGHWTVPDDRALIRKALDVAGETSDLLFVTGGLGPTTDDFTREMISEWTKLPLEWHEPSWERVRERLAVRGLPVQESQRQQCFFPRSSEILENSQGTANAFRVSAAGKTLVVLPGPPREIEAIWSDHLASWLPGRFPGLDPWITRSWDTIGLPESVIAARSEQALEGCRFEKGYRVHLPYVEVKLSYHRSEQEEARPWVEKLDRALAPDTALRDGQTAIDLVTGRLARFAAVTVVDQVSEGFLWGRWAPALSRLMKEKSLTWTDRAPSEASTDLVLELRPAGPRRAEARLRWRGLRRRTVLDSPFPSALLIEREKQYFAEKALLFWANELSVV